MIEKMMCTLIAALLLILSSTARAEMKDIVEMTKEGVSEDVLLAYVKSHPETCDLTINDVRLMFENDVPGSVIKGMLQRLPKRESAPASAVEARCEEQKSARRIALEQRRAEEEQEFEERKTEREARGDEPRALTPQEEAQMEQDFRDEEFRLRLLDAERRQEQRDYIQRMYALQNATFEDQFQLNIEAQQDAVRRDLLRYGPYR